MIDVRLLLATVAGTFCMTLGIFALLKNPRHQLNRSCAFFNIANALWNFSGYAMFVRNHAVALWIYRTLQIGGPLVLYNATMFFHELLEIRGNAFPTALRRTFAVYAALMLVLLQTPWIIRDISVTLGENLPFREIPGPLYPYSYGFIAVGFLMSTGFFLSSVRYAAGIKRNQLKFASLSIWAAIVSAFFYLLSFTVIDLPWTYFPGQMVASFGLAYAIFKYRLFDFTLWWRRLTMFAIVYIALIGLPFVATIPIKRSMLASLGPWWWAVPLTVVAYAALFSLAPLVTTFFRDKSEQRRWDDLHGRLDILRKASQNLAGERGNALSDVSARIVEVLRQFFWNGTQSPLSFIAAIAVDQNDRLAFDLFPRQNVDVGVLHEFLHCLKSVPSLLEKPFSRLDVEQKMRSVKRTETQGDLTTIGRYLSDNGIDFCFPCLHNGLLRGALLLGPKQKGIFWPEEVTALQMVSANVAMAVSNTELIGHNTELLEHNKELLGMDQLKSDLISNITHEFKSPLNIVENAVDILLQDLGRGKVPLDKTSDYLLMIRNNAGRLGMFIQNLLEVAKIEKAKIDMRLGPCDLAALVGEAAEMVKPLAEHKRIALACDAKGPLYLTLDEEKMRQVFYNLLSNAIKYTEAGRVEISLAVGTSAARVRVRDTGRGIDPRHLASVFDRFFRVEDPEGERTKGTGLGLAIAKGWTEAHGGKIWAESRGAGTGAEFIVELPTRRGAPEWEGV